MYKKLLFVNHFVKKSPNDKIMILLKIVGYVSKAVNSIPAFALVNEIVTIAKKIDYHSSGFVNAVAKKMVTFMDGETKVAGVGVIEGEKVDVVSIPGYDVVWMNGDVAFDFDTAITEDITLTVGTKTEKTIRFTADSTTSTGKDSAGAPVFGENGRYKVTLETSSADKHKLSLKWYFDLTVEDIEAFKEMGYGTLEFDFNISLTGGQTANGKTYSLLNGAKTITVADQNQWIHISVTLDELAKYVTSGNGKFFEHTYVHYWPTIELKDMGLVKATTQA